QVQHENSHTKSITSMSNR
ncbi:unnamed protein product, partial [Allacma fusca]